MKESCFCGRTDELEDREPILDSEGRWALRCPECGHLDYLAWLPEEAGLLLWGEAKRRHDNRLEKRHAANSMFDPLLQNRKVAGHASTIGRRSPAYCSSSRAASPGEMLPQEMGYGSGMTCWHQAGVWGQLHKTMLDRLGQAEEIDWERASLDSSSIAAPRGAIRLGRTRQTRANRAQSAMLW